MLEDTIKRIENRLHEAGLPESEKEKLLQLVETLRSELEQLPQDKREDAGSVAAFAEVATAEALREQKNPQLMEHASAGLNKALEGMEQDFPGLTRVVGQLCNFLSGMGI